MINEIVGREKERRILSEALHSSLNSRGQTVILSGGAGIGKSTLVEYIKNEAKSHKIVICNGEATIQDNSIPYLPFQRALEGLTREEIFQTEEFAFFDDIFLINKAGLLISHVSRSMDEGIDEDILGSMLTAVQDFVKDSFGDSGAEAQKGGLGKLEYMDTKIFIEHGDLVYMAVVTSGEEHPDMKQTIKKCLAEVETTYFDILKDWNGDIDTLSGTPEILKRYVGVQFRVKRSLENINLESERLKTQDKILELILENSEAQGILVILEDLHWADMSTILTLPYLARNIQGSKVLLCITYRQGDMEETNPGYKTVLDQLSLESAYALSIPLLPIDDDSAEKIASNVLGGSHPPDELLASLKTEADGNPFFIIEAIRALTGDNTLYKDGEVWVLRHGPKAAIPHSVSALISRRLDSLDLDCLRFIEYGAILGRHFEKSLLLAGFSTEPAIADRIILSLIDMNIFTSLPGNVIMFQHSKTQEVVYSGLSERWKKAMHRNAGIFIENRNRANIDAVLFSLAYHFSCAQDTEKGIDYCVSAGYKASNNLAPRESIQFFEQAITLLDLSGKMDERAPEIIESLGDLYELDGNYPMALARYGKAMEIDKGMSTAARILMKEGRVIQAQGKYDEAIAVLEEGIKLADEAGFSFWKAKISSYLGKIFLRKGLYEQALELQMGYLRESNATGEPREIGQACMNIGGVHFYLKNYSQAISFWTKANEHFRKAGYNQGIAFINDNLGGAHLMLGKLNEALVYYTDSEAMMNKIGDVKGLSMVLNNMGALHDDLGDYQTSLKLYEKSLQIKKRIGDTVGVANIYNNIGSACFNMGLYDDALRNYNLNHQIMLKSGDTWGISQALNNIAEAEIELGMLAESREHCRESLDLAEKHSFREIQTDVYRLMGSQSAIEGDNAKAEEFFGRSLALATEIEEPQKVGMLHLARARSIRGEFPTEAIDSYAKAMGVFDRAGMENMSSKVRKEMQSLVDSVKNA